MTSALKVSDAKSRYGNFNDTKWNQDELFEIEYPMSGLANQQ